MRRTLIAAALAFSACNIQPPSEDEACGVFVDSQNTDTVLNDQVLVKVVKAVLDGAETVTDKRLSNRAKNCETLRYTRVVTKTDTMWKPPEYAYSVAGLSYCWKNYIVVATPGDGRWRSSAVNHELFHVLQNCLTEKEFLANKQSEPVNFHEGWSDNGITSAIDTIYQGTDL